MADDPRKDGRRDTLDPKQSGPEPKSLSDEVVEEIKKEILFGVGYKRPPKQHQFKKGQSGNPKGRPRSGTLPMSDRSANALALNQAERLIGVRDGEETKQITAIEAVFRAQYATACKGNAYAQKHSIERYDLADRERRRQIQESIEFWKQYVDEARKAIAETARKGEPPPTLLPHPDDVAIDYKSGVRLIGPVDEADLKQVEEACRIRDLLIAQDALDRREADEPDHEEPLDGPGTALLFATILNESIPDRFKLSDGEIDLRMLRYAHIPKRQLLKELYRGWRSLGVHSPRGKVFPPLRIGKERIELHFDLAQRFRDGRLDIDSPPEELEAEIALIMLERQQAVK